LFPYLCAFSKAILTVSGWIAVLLAVIGITAFVERGIPEDPEPSLDDPLF
jgi:hypothetical protein